MLRLRPVPFRWKVAALPALSTIGVTLAVAWAQVHLTSERIVQEAGREVAGVALAVADRLARDMAARGTEVRLLALVRAQQPDSPPHEIRRQLELLQRQVPSYAWIGFLDAEGRVVAATGGVFEGGRGADRPVFTQGRKGLWFGDLHPAVVLERVLNPVGAEALEFVDVATPVHDMQQRFRGVLAAHLGWRWAREVAEDVLRPYENRHRLEVLILDAQGHVIQGPAAMRQRPVPIDPRALPQPGERYRLARWDDGTEAMTAVAHSGRHGDFPGLGWRVVVRQPIGVALAQARQAGQQIFAWGAGVGLAFLGVGLWLARRVSQPVHQLLRSTGGLQHAAGWAGLASDRRQVDVRWVAELMQRMDRDLTSREREVRRLRHEATHDPLTGLPNRAFLAALLERAAVPTREVRELVVMCMDLDDFKGVNDRHGHDVGDVVLREVAWRLRSLLRDEDVPVRLGGDEFLVLAEAAPGDGERLADSMAERLVQALGVPIRVGASVVPVGCSLGAVVWRSDAPVSLQAAWTRADQALYQAKSEGKCRWRRLPLDPGPSEP